MKVLYPLLILATFILSGCTLVLDTQPDSVDTPPYAGKGLNVAVIGEAPSVRERQVAFSAITLDEMYDNSRSLSAEYDAVIIMKEHLSEAAEARYAEVYQTAGIPFFFIGSTKSYMPFVLEDLDYEDVPEMNNEMYATGYFNAEDKWQFWATGLYNNKVNNRNIKSAYSAVFEAINNWPVK
ncbi:hypothetical protein NST84_25150 [Paenibacillus sp. FSL R7-0345]|uniref:hypothetical protein n=1 Tax=Paenibacillus sp. FSL R7-0345 TaxID=2954535 RepID=UPI00315ADD4A